MKENLEGKVVWIFADNFTSDLITDYPKYSSVTDQEGLTRICMIKFDPEFRKKVEKGDFVVAGENFGFGHPHSQAHKALLAVGISALIVESCARNWFRTAVNMGLPVISCRGIYDSTRIGDRLEVNLTSGEVKNLTSKVKLVGQPLPSFMLEIIDSGGLIPYLRKRLTGEKRTKENA